MKIEDYPLAKELIFDAEGNISQVILNYTGYQYLLDSKRITKPLKQRRYN